MKIIPELVKNHHKKELTIAVIRADNADCAESYYKGRFGKRGEVTRKKKGNLFEVTEIRE